MANKKCPECGNDVETWEYVNFEILQIMPAKDIFGIFVFEDGSLALTKAGAIGLAKATTVKRVGHRDLSCLVARESIANVSNRVVGLDLCSGWFEVMDEASNFAGLCTSADDPWSCLGCLEWHKNKEFETASKRYRESRNPSEGESND